LSKTPATGRITKALLITSFVLLGTLLSAPIATSSIGSHALGITQSATATDSSLPQQSATSSQTVAVSSSLAGNFGICANLPLGWNCGNLHSGAPSPSSAQIVTGVFQSRQSNPGLGGSNDYYYSTTQKGTFPWTPCSAPATGVIPSGVSSISVNFTSLSYNPGSSPSSDRYHIYIALYYWLPNGSVSAGGSTYQCLDTQVRVENIGGTFSPIGSTATYNPGDSFGWDNVTLQISPGQTGTLTANVANQCLQDLIAWGLPTNTPCQLAGIEIGTEGYQFQELDVNWYDVSLDVGPIPLSTGFAVSPTNPTVNMPVIFTATTIGGTSPYTINWSFGDGATGTGAIISHTYSSVQSFTVTETATDSSSPIQNAIKSQTVTVQPIPPLSTSFTVLPSSALVNSPVTFTAVTTGGTLPYLITWNFGDGTTGTGASTVHTYTTAASFTVAETATDSSSPTQTAMSSQSIIVYASFPLSITTFQASSYSLQVGQTVTFSASVSGGTAPYTYTLALGDGKTRSGNPVTYTYSAAGSYTANLTVTDSASPQVSTWKTLTVNVQPLVPPLLTIPGNQTATAGTWINFTITASSTNTGGTVTLSATGLPSGANFDAATGLFSWKPSSGQTGSYTIRFIATDSSSPSTPTSKPMQIQVNQAAPGGSNGGSGGSGGGSNGSCLLCGIVPTVSTNISLLVIGGLLGIVGSLALLTIRARSSLERTKRRLRT
jgi:PKD repeat protein